MGTYLLALDQGHHRGAGHPPGPPGLAGVYGVTAGEHSSPLRLGCCFVSRVGAATRVAPTVGGPCAAARRPGRGYDPG